MSHILLVLEETELCESVIEWTIAHVLEKDEQIVIAAACNRYLAMPLFPGRNIDGVSEIKTAAALELAERLSGFVAAIAPSVKVACRTTGNRVGFIEHVDELLHDRPRKVVLYMDSPEHWAVRWVNGGAISKLLKNQCESIGIQATILTDQLVRKLHDADAFGSSIF